MEEVLFFLVGTFGVPAINFIKTKVNNDSKIVNTGIAASVSVVIALIAMFVSDSAELSTFAVDNLPNAFGLVFSGATLAYKVLAK